MTKEWVLEKIGSGVILQNNIHSRKLGVTEAIIPASKKDEIVLWAYMQETGLY